MTEQTPPGHVVMLPDELEGETLAWAACALWQVPAAILEGRVHVIADDGTAEPFDPAVMLRSLIKGRAMAVYVPDEIAKQAKEKH